jgi:hypothetical protein
MNVSFIKIFTVNFITKTPLIGFYSDAVYLNLAKFTTIILQCFLEKN